MRVLLLCLLLACAPFLSSSAVILDNGLPIMWAQTPSQLWELPTPNGTVTPNPWNYLHRMSLIRLLLAATDANMGFIGSSGTENPLWGLPLQLAWMLISGTLMQKTQNKSDTRGVLWAEHWTHALSTPPNCELIPQVAWLTQPEFHNVASKLEIICVFPLRAGGAVSMAEKQHNKCKIQSTKCLKSCFIFQVWITSVLCCPSCLQCNKASWVQAFRYPVKPH